MYWVGMAVFEDKLFAKEDAKGLVNEKQISLNDQFNSLKNKSDIATGDYYHIFRLKISTVH
ncbi:MAG: hypothetical protein EOO91_07240 [Pedobacter sp.]|nr:MAG: hypothetical protein EOO91_07240 [Pedobacter sp.]